MDSISARTDTASKISDLQQQVRLCQPILQQVERRRAEPMKIIEEKSQRMFRLGENTDESAKHELKAALRRDRRRAPR